MSISISHRLLDSWVKEITKLPGVIASQSLSNLIHLGDAEAIVRETRAEADEATRTTASRLGDLAAEVRTATAYARVCRERKERADATIAKQAATVRAHQLLIGRRRDATLVLRVFTAWSLDARQERRARDDQDAARNALALADMSQRAASAREAAAERGCAAEAALGDLADADAHMAIVNAQLSAERVALATAVRMHVEASREATARATADRQAEQRKTKAAEVRERLVAEFYERQHLEGQLLHSSLSDAERELRSLRAALADSRAACEAQRRQIECEQRSAKRAGVRRALAHAASEHRLLLLLKSQRERLKAQASELTGLRRGVALKQELPEIEAPWLAPTPPSPAPEHADETKAYAAGADRARREWINAMAHAI